MDSSIFLHWQVYEYEHRERSTDWYWAIGILSVAAALTSIILNNVLFAIVILLSGASMIIFSARKPRLIDVEINEKGIRVDKTFYPFLTLESFWVDDDHEHPRLFVKSQKLLMPYIIIPLGEVDGSEIKEVLIQKLPEVFHTESIFHRAIDHIGF